MMSFGMYALVILAIFFFLIAVAHRLRYEKEISNKNATSNQLDRLVVLEQIYGSMGLVSLLIALTAAWSELL